MKSHRQPTTRRFSAIGSISIIIGLALALASPVLAADYTWTNTANGTSDYWTNGVFWAPAFNDYPGGVGASPNAYLTNNGAVGGSYTNLLNFGLTKTIGTLVISNGNNGQAWLIVTNNAGATGVNLTNTTFVLGNGGRLQLDSGGVVTGITTFTWLGTNGTIYLNNGGQLFSGGALTIGSGISNVNATVSSLGGAGNGGLWNANNQTLTIGTGAATGTVLTISSGATVSNVGAVTIGATGGSRGNGLVINNGGNFFGNGAITIGNAAGASNNFYNIGGGVAAVTVSNNGAISVGAGGGSYNSLTVTNANLWSNGLNLGNNGNSLLGATNNSATVLANSTWNLMSGNVVIGSDGLTALSNSLTVNGGVLTNVGVFLEVGGGTGGGAQNGSYSTLLITNGGVVLRNAASQLNIGFGGGSNNVVKVTGAGSVLKTLGTATSLLVNDGSGINNQLIVSDGGKVLYDVATVQIGAFAGNNSVLVTDSGSIWSNALKGGGSGAGFGFAIGNTTSGNSMTISNGGAVYNLGGTGANDGNMILGSGANGKSNQVTITGSGSVWSNANTQGDPLTIGSAGGKFNSLTVTNGGKYFANSSITVGNANGSVSNSLNIGGVGLASTLILTDQFGNSAISIGSAAGANYNTMTVTNATVESHGASWVGNNGGSNNSITVTTNSTWNLGGQSLNVGSLTAYGNSVTVYGGGFLTNAGAVNVGGLASNTLLVTDGGKLSATGVGVSGSNTITFTGTGTVVNATGSASVGAYSMLVISNGARASFGAQVAPDGGVGKGQATVIVTGPGTAVSAGTQLWIGLFSGSNSVTVADHAVMTASSTVIGGGGAQPALSNTLTVTGGATFTNAAGLTMGDNADDVGGVVTVSNGGVLVNAAGGTSLGAGRVGSSNNSVVVTGIGSVISNNGALTVGTIAGNNSLTVANGGIFINTTGVIGSSNSGSNNTVTVTGPGSAWTNSSSLILANAANLISNRVIVANGGTAVIGSTLTVGGVAGANSNSVLVTSGGVLQANTLAIGATTTGNTISNAGGVYQFTTVAPTLTSRAAGDIAISGGTISFLGINNADVTNNLGNGALKSIAFSGANTFMLNSASNNTSGQAYTFAVTASPSNYVNLALINGQTAYRGGGVTIGATGSLLASNTTASFTDVVTNQGVAVLLNGSATFTGGLYNQGTVTNSNNLITGALTMNNGTFVAAGGPAQTLSGAVSLPGAGTFDTAVSLKLAGGLAGSGNLTKLGASDLVLPVATAFGGDTRPIAGAMVLGNSYALSNSTVNLAGGDTGSLMFSNNGAYTLGGLKGGSGRLLALTGSDNNPVALTVGNNGQNTTFGGTITGSGSITKIGSGVLVFAGANSYSGDTYINAGQLVLADPSAAANTAIVNPNNGGLAFSNATSFTVAGLSGAGNIGLTNVGGSGIGLTVSNANNSLTYSGVMSGSGSLTKAGDATFELTGHNTFNGTVDVTAGRLLVNGSLAGGAPLTLSAGATLAGSGTVGRAVSGAGQVAPGNSPGLLTVNQLDPSAGMGFEFEFTQLLPNFGNLGAIGNDVLRITNATPFTVALGLSNTVNLVVTAPLTAGVINYLRGGFYSDSGAMFDPTINGATYNLFIDDGGPLAFVHTVAETTPWGTGRILEIGVWGKMIPEPQVVMFWLTGVATLYAARRRMQRRK